MSRTGARAAEVGPDLSCPGDYRSAPIQSGMLAVSSCSSLGLLEDVINCIACVIDYLLTNLRLEGRDLVGHPLFLACPGRDTRVRKS